MVTCLPVAAAAICGVTSGGIVVEQLKSRHTPATASRFFIFRIRFRKLFEAENPVHPRCRLPGPGRLWSRTRFCVGTKHLARQTRFESFRHLSIPGTRTHAKIPSQSTIPA